MRVFQPGDSIEQYYNTMGYRTIDDQIEAEVQQYVKMCRCAAQHTVDEDMYRSIAHRIFYHILELRSTRKPTPLNYES